jgi:hypothetical protein
LKDESIDKAAEAIEEKDLVSRVKQTIAFE